MKTLWLKFNQLFEGNRLIEDAKPPKPNSVVLRRLMPMILVGMLGGFFVASQVVLIPLVLLILPFINPWLVELGASNPLMAETLTFTINLIIFFAGIYIVIFIWVRFMEKRPFKTIGFHPKRALRRFVFGFSIATLSMGLIALLLLLFGDAKIDQGGLAETGLTALPFVLIVLIGWLVQGSAEEVLFQGWFMPTSSKLLSPSVGIALSALMFAFFHAFNPNMSGLAFLNLTLYGVFAALYALYEEGIIGIAAYHVAWNWTQGNVFGQGVSGASSIDASFWNLSYQSENLFNGGAFGPEGGLVTTIVLLISIVTVGWLTQKKGVNQT